jgi:arginase family enzyme
MLLLIRTRYPRTANILGWISGFITLAISIACGASTTVLILGGGSSIALGVIRFLGRRHPQLVAHRGTARAR